MCTPISPPPVGQTCGILGFPTGAVVGYSAESVYVTQNGCAEFCNAAVGCLSFYVDVGSSCYLYGGTVEGNGFTEDDNSPYTAYDLSCFDCTIVTTTTTPASTAASSAQPSATCVHPAGAICNTIGDLTTPIGPLIISSSQEPQDGTPTGCSALCSTVPECVSRFLEAGTCYLLNANLAEAGFVADPDGAFEGSDAACSICVTATSSAAPSATSSTQPSTMCVPPAGALCNIIANFDESYLGYAINVVSSDSPAECSATCATSQICVSWLFGGGNCFLFFDDLADVGVTPAAGGDYEGSDAACSICVTATSSAAPSAISSAQPSATSSAQPSATCIPPAGAICNTIGVFPASPAAFVINQSLNPNDLTLAGCSALCAGFAGCLAWDLGEGYCTLFNADQTTIGFVPNPAGDFIGSDATCLCPLAPSAISSAQPSATSSAQPSATCIPPAGAICNTIGVFPASPAAFVIDQSLNPNDLTLAGCSALCAGFAGCLAWDLGEGYCTLFNADQMTIGFVPNPAGNFIGSDATCLCPLAPSAISSAQPSATSSAQPSATCIPPAGAICNTIGVFPASPAAFVINQSLNPNDLTLAGCSALCAGFAGCLAWDLGEGYCTLFNADQTTIGFVPNPAGDFIGSDATCLCPLAPSAISSAQPSATSSAQPSATCIPPAGAICNTIGVFPASPAAFVINQSLNPNDLTLAGCSALCAGFAGCLAWDLGEGYCTLFNADQTTIGFVPNPAGDFIGSDATCLCPLVPSAISSAQPSATSSAQPSATCIPPAGAICNTIGVFPASPAAFLLTQSPNADDLTLAGCSALCAGLAGCLSWDLGEGFCSLFNANQITIGFVPNPAGDFIGSDATCLCPLAPSAASSAQPSAASSAAPSTIPLAQPSAPSSAQSSTTSPAQPSAQPSTTSPAQPSAQPSTTSPAQPSAQPSSSSAIALPSTFATPASSGSPSVLTRRSLSLSTIQQSSVQTAISATLSQAALLSATVSVAAAPASSLFGQSSVPIAFVSAPKSQASVKFSNSSVSIRSFSGAIQTPSAIASVNLGAVISSTATALPTVIPFSGFLRVINPAVPGKRQLDRLSFLKVNIDSTVSRINTCSSASIFFLGTNGQLTSNGLTAFATTGDIVNGISDFTFGSDEPANIQTTFSFPGDVLEWNNNAFTGNQAIFAFPPTPPFVLNAIFDGTVPDGYTEMSFQLLAFGSVEAAEAGCGLASNTGTVTTLMTTSTVCTTIVYTITKCPPTVYDCPIGHKTTETISLYTTVCPVDPAEPTEPIYSIGVLVTIFIDITIEINIQNGVLETIYVTDIILSTENGLYNAATSAQPCYPCKLSSQGYQCPDSGVTVTQSICRSCPTFDSPPTWAAPVVQTCNTCAPITIYIDVVAAPTSPAQPGLPNGVAVSQSGVQISGVQNPAVPNPALPNPAVPNPAVPNPSVPNPAVANPAVPNPGQPPIDGAALASPAIDFPSQPAASEAAGVAQEGGQNNPPQNAEVQSGGNPPAISSSLAGGVSAPASPQQASDAARLLRITMRACIFPVLSIFWL